MLHRIFKGKAYDRNLGLFLCFVCKIKIARGVGKIYRRMQFAERLIYGNKRQDKIKGFNERFVMVSIRHVERYLTKIGIDMGIDEKNVYNVTVQNGQAIIANDNSTVTATTHIGVNANELERLIAAVRTKMDTLTDTDKETASESLEVIEAEIVSEKPKKSMIKTAITSLQAIKGVAEFGAAVSALIQFIGSMLS